MECLSFLFEREFTFIIRGIKPFVSCTSLASFGNKKSPEGDFYYFNVTFPPTVEAELLFKNLRFSTLASSLLSSTGNYRFPTPSRSIPILAQQQKEKPTKGFLFVGGQGIEPRFDGPEPSVLPLDDPPKAQSVS